MDHQPCDYDCPACYQYNWHPITCDCMQGVIHYEVIFFGNVVTEKFQCDGCWKKHKSQIDSNNTSHDAYQEKLSPWVIQALKRREEERMMTNEEKAARFRR